METDTSSQTEPPHRAITKICFFRNNLRIYQDMIINSPTDKLRRIVSVILACPESFRIKEGFPTSGNDRHNKHELLSTEAAHPGNACSNLQIYINHYVV